MRRRTLATPACFIIAVLLAGCGRADARAPGVCDARAAAANLDFTLRDVEGRALDLRDFRGRVIVMNFWATWCAPCRTEIPWLVELHREHARAGLVVLGISVDEDVARIAPFARELGIDYPVLVGRGAEEFRESFGPLLGFPTTILITREGRICRAHRGITQRATLEAEVGELLRAN